MKPVFSSMLRKSATLALSLLFVLVSSCGASDPPLYPLGIGEQVFMVELARTPRERQTGLMYRENLPENQGMLFVFEEPQMLSFWMKNTYINLSIAYVDESGRIIDILDMYARDESPVPSSGPALYALELNQGAFERAGIRVGDRLDFNDIPLE